MRQPDLAPTAEEDTVFEAVIVPHRSLSRRGLRILILVICGLCFCSSTVFFLLGAWPVVGFCGGEILIAVLLLRANARAQREREQVSLSASGLRIVRTDSKGRREETVLAPAWLRLSLHESPGRVPRLLLQAQGVRAEIAASLGEDEKRDLATALQQALHRWRHPEFDNPQLRTW
jgi:uncharacterized membrane protein